MAECLEVRNLSVGYGKGKAVLENLNFSLERGKLYSLLGSNGVGKSTLLLTLAGQLKALSGKILIDGKESSEFSGQELSKKIAVLFTERETAGGETVFETAAKGRYPYTGWFGSLSENDRNKVLEALKATDSLSLKDRPFDNLSDGQKQRVLIARAIAQETDLLILDEPTGYLDLKYQIEIMELLRKIAAEKDVSIIISIHELYLAGEFSDIMLLLKDKGLFAFDSPEKLMNAETIGKIFDLDPSVCNKLKLF